MASVVVVKSEKRPAADSQDADSNAKKPRYVQELSPGLLLDLPVLSTGLIEIFVFMSS